MCLNIHNQFLAAGVPATGETSTLPLVIAFLGIAAVLLIITLILRRKNR